MKPRAIIGVTLLTCGIASFLAGGAVLARGLQASKVAEQQKDKSEENCKLQLKTLGGVVSDTGKGLSIIVKDLQDPKAAMADAAVAVAMCPTRTITDFCLGSACALATGEAPSRRVNMSFLLTGR